MGKYAVKEKNVNGGFKKDRADSAIRKDVATVSIINGLNFLIKKANDMGIYSVTRTLIAAKEDLVFWAVQMNYHETLEEKFVNRYLCDQTAQNIEDIERFMQASDAGKLEFVET